MDESGDDGDEDEEFEKSQVDGRGVDAEGGEPCEGAVACEEGVDAPVEGTSEGEDEDDGDAEAVGGGKACRACQVGAHSEEGGEDEVLDEYRLY